MTTNTGDYTAKHARITLNLQSLIIGRPTNGIRKTKWYNILKFTVEKKKLSITSLDYTR